MPTDNRFFGLIHCTHLRTAAVHCRLFVPAQSNCAHHSRRDRSPALHVSALRSAAVHCRIAPAQSNCAHRPRRDWSPALHGSVFGLRQFTAAMP